MPLTPEQRACAHAGKPDELGARHTFEWPGFNRNVWNPFHPSCTLCGASIGDIVNDHFVLIAKVKQLQLKVDCEGGVLAMTVARLGGIVEGQPTQRINFLQRIDALREIEKERDALRADLDAARADLRKAIELAEKSQRCMAPSPYYKDLRDELAALKAKGGQRGQ